MKNGVAHVGVAVVAFSVFIRLPYVIRIWTELEVLLGLATLLPVIVCMFLNRTKCVWYNNKTEL